MAADVAAAHIENAGADAPPHRDLGPHAVCPEPVDQAVFERLRRGQSEIDAGPRGSRHRGDPDPIALQIDASFSQQPAEPHLDPGCRSDAAPLDHADIAAPGAEIGAHDEKPIHALRLRAEQLGTLPFGKGGQRRMCRAADEIDMAVTHLAIGAVDREDQLQRDVEAFVFEEAELDGCYRREIGVRDQVGDSELHRELLFFAIRRPYQDDTGSGRVIEMSSSDRHQHVDWKTHGVKVIPGDQLDPNTAQTPGMDRAAAINLARVGAQKIWAGTVKIHANAKTGAHHHGHLESVIYVLKGRARMRWGDHLEYVAEAGPGDFI